MPKRKLASENAVNKIQKLNNDSTSVARTQGYKKHRNPQGRRFSNQPGRLYQKKVFHAPRSRKEYRDLRKMRKSCKPHADYVAKANRLWKMGIKKMKREERTVAIKKLLSEVKDVIAAIIVKHDSSRVFQIITKYGSEEQHRLIFNACKPKIYEIAANNYGHHVLLKLVKYCVPLRKEMLDLFIGKLHKFTFSAYAGKILDFLFITANKKVQRIFMNELYYPANINLLRLNKSKISNNGIDVYGDKEEEKGNDKKSNKKGKNKSVNLFLNVVDDKLKKIIKSNDILELLKVDEKDNEKLLINIDEYIQKAMQKEMLGFRFMHKAILEYTQQMIAYNNYDKLEKFLSSLNPFVLSLYHSKDGVRILGLCIRYGKNSLRKGIIKYFKQNIYNIAIDQYGHNIISNILQYIDDTRLTNKIITRELMDNLHRLIMDRYGSKVILHILAPETKRYFSQDEMELFKRVKVPEEYKDFNKQTVDKKEFQFSNKKDALKRRQEILDVILDPLIAIAQKYGYVYFKDKVATNIYIELIKVCKEFEKQEQLDELLENLIQWSKMDIEQLNELYKDLTVDIRYVFFESREDQQQEEEPQYDARMSVEEPNENAQQEEEQQQPEEEEEEEEKVDQLLIVEDPICHSSLKRVIKEGNKDFNKKWVKTLDEEKLITKYANIRRGGLLLLVAAETTSSCKKILKSHKKDLKKIDNKHVKMLVKNHL